MNDFIGRGIAEQQASVETVAVTLTYSDTALAKEAEVEGPSRPAAAAILQYTDVQKLMKRLRKAGHQVRYVVAGEYGSNKGRAHWHAILFFRGEKRLDAPQAAERFDWSFWPHGFSYFQRPDYKGFRYVMKYALKNEDIGVSIGKLSMSKKPPLGYDFFMALADKYVERGLSPQHGFYKFRDVVDNKGKLRKFQLKGRMKELFLDRFTERWTQVHGDKPIPESEFVLDYHDEVFRRSPEGIQDAAERFAARMEARGVVRAVTSQSVRLDMETVATVYSDGWIAVEREGQKGWLVKGEEEIKRAVELLALDREAQNRLWHARRSGAIAPGSGKIHRYQPESVEGGGSPPKQSLRQS